jgi:hypothetical protein
MGILEKLFGKKKSETNRVEDLIPTLKVENISDVQQWLNTINRLFNENAAMYFLDIYVECGMSREIAFSKNVDLINANIPIKKNSKENDIFRTYQNAIASRCDLQNLPLPLYEMNPIEYGLNIPSNETIYHIIYNVIIHEERTVRRDVVYSGMRWTNGLLRAGSISVIGNEIKNFAPLDAGKLVITDKRLIFIGTQKNVTKSIKISDILMYQLYKEGVLVRQPNKKAILFEFEYFEDFEIFQIQDGLNQFVIVLDRIINKTDKTDFFKKKVENNTHNINIQSNQEINTIENAYKQLEDVKNSVEEVRKTVNSFKIQSAAIESIPMCNYHLDELKKLNNTLETNKEPTILESCMRNMIVHITWFVEQENEYPNAPWNMVGGALDMIEKVKNRYNEILYLIVKELFEDYKLKMSKQISEFKKNLETEIIFEHIQYYEGFIEKTARNHQECLDSFNEFHNGVEDLFSST